MLDGVYLRTNGEQVFQAVPARTIEQLQYTQITDIEFHHPFGGGDGLIVWPHLNINTMRKQ